MRCPAFVVSLSTAMLGTTLCSNVRKLSKPCVEHTAGESSSKCSRPPARPPPKRRCAGSASFVRCQVETKAKDLVPEARARLRQERAEPILTEFKVWLDDTLLKLPPASRLAEAIGYTLGRWPALLVS